MKTIAYMMAAAIFAAAVSVASPVSAQLLGGLLGGGGGGGSGGGGGGVDLDFSDGGGGVDGVLELGYNTDNGTNANGQVFGGGNNLTIPLGDLTGDDSSLDLDLPALAGLLDGDDGGAGGPGMPGVNGANGANGINGGNGAGDLNLGTGSRLRFLIQVLQSRAWLRLAQGEMICLPGFRVSNVASWAKPSERGALQQIINAFAPDIRLFQQMLYRCDRGHGRQMNIGRVIGLQLREDGQIVVMTI